MKLERSILVLALCAPATAQAPAGESPALGQDRITQGDITSGALSVRDIRRKGLEIFSTSFNKLDGFGDGPPNPADPTSPGGRPTLEGNGSFLRVQGLDSQSCLECHSIRSSRTRPHSFAVGGAGNASTNAMSAATEIDVDDSLGNGFAFYDGRNANPPALFGAGGVELLGKEMTAELQDLLLQAFMMPGTVVPLVTKGIDFGSISFDATSGMFDTSNIDGVAPDLVVRPFGRKGDQPTVRSTSAGAIAFHHGMQPVETAGAGLDPDGDGVSDEIFVGELSALHVFIASLDRPIEIAEAAPIANLQAQLGREVFSQVGCATCHVPFLDADATQLTLTEPVTQSVYFTLDLAAGSADFQPAPGGGLRVRLFSDLKRHDMGPALAESTGGALAPFFVTARLWGVADTAPYLHDGRALTLTEAIELHGGDAQPAADNFANLSDDGKRRLLSFLRSLRAPANPSADLR